MEFFLFASLGVTLDTHFFAQISRTLQKFKFVFLRGFLYRMWMAVRKKWHLEHKNHEKSTFKFTLNITLLKNLILLSMLFLKKSCNWPLISQPGRPERGPSDNILTSKFPRREWHTYLWRRSCGVYNWSTLRCPKSPRFTISHVRISQKVKGVLMWNLQYIIFVWRRRNWQIFKSALVYL